MPWAVELARYRLTAVDDEAGAEVSPRRHGIPRDVAAKAQGEPEVDGPRKRHRATRDELAYLREPDGWMTSLLHLGLSLLALILSFFGTWFVLIQGNCANTPNCDSGPFAIASFLVGPGMAVVFGLSVIASIILRATRRKAWYIPVAAGVMIGLCFSVGTWIASAAAESAR